MSLPEMTNPGLILSLGAAAEEYILSRRMAGYLPAEHAKPFLDSGELYLVLTRHGSLIRFGCRGVMIFHPKFSSWGKT